MMPIRISKIILSSCLGMYMLLVVFNNTTDYQSNFGFVSHVLSMDTTFPDNEGMWRSIRLSPLHHTFYILIILTEFAIAAMCFWGARTMWKKRKASKAAFRDAQTWAIYGLTLGVVLWFLGFVSIGGEWFLMWQSEVWNGTEVAMRNAILFSLILFFISYRHE